MAKSKQLTNRIKTPNAATMAVLTGVFVVTGKWANDEDLEISLAVGILGYAVGLSVLHEILPEVAEQLAWIVALTTAFTYGHIVMYNADLTDIYPKYASAMGIKVEKK